MHGTDDVMQGAGRRPTRSPSPGRHRGHSAEAAATAAAAGLAGVREEGASTRPPGVPQGEEPAVPLVFVPTYDPAADSDPGLGARLAALNAGIRTAFTAAGNHLDALTTRVIGSEAAHRTLQTDARTVVEDVIGQARQEFERQSESLQTLRADVQQEAVMTRQVL